MSQKFYMSYYVDVDIRAQLIFSKMRKIDYFFLTRNHGHWLPLEAQIWLKFWSRTMFHLSRLTNFWGKIPLNPVELLFFLISY